MAKRKKTHKFGEITHTEGTVFPIGGSMGITLPKSWVIEHKLMPGDVVVKVANSILTICKKDKP